MPAHRSAARRLNENCACTTLDGDLLKVELARQRESDVFGAMAQTHPHLFSKAPVFVSHGDMAAMCADARAIEDLASTPDWAEGAACRAWPDRGGRGVMMGYDFHIGAEGPRLIEINTNAGGAFVNLMARRAARQCCGDISPGSEATPDDAEARIASMFVEEWRRVRGSGQPGLIAIVDDAPDRQYLFPEFLLAVRLLENHGLDAEIAAPDEIVTVDGDLFLRGRRIDMIYNRLTDFDLSDPAHAAIRRAYLADRVVLSPDPRVHALLADKRNLIRLSDDAWLEAIGAPPSVRALMMRHVPRTVAVTTERAEALWADRAAWYFKPATGHGGKAVWRGDKVTRKNWAAIIDGGYVAQALVTPPERIVEIDGARDMRKFDLRLYTYGGETLAVAARLYRGQTTNFRTPGGGFAPVFLV